MMMSDDDPNEKNMPKRPMRQAIDPNNPSTTPGIPSVPNAAQSAADPHGGRQRNSGKGDLTPAPKLPEQSAQGRRGTSGGGPTKGEAYSGFKGQPGAGRGNSMNQGGRKPTGGGGGTGSANITKGRSSSR